MLHSDSSFASNLFSPLFLTSRMRFLFTHTFFSCDHKLSATYSSETDHVTLFYRESSLRAKHSVKQWTLVALSLKFKWQHVTYYHVFSYLAKVHNKLHLFCSPKTNIAQCRRNKQAFYFIEIGMIVSRCGSYWLSYYFVPSYIHNNFLVLLYISSIPQFSYITCSTCFGLL
jgi:hypothetical protein